MNEVELNIGRSQESALSVNKVVRNTYMLLSMTLFFSAICATASMAMQVGQGTGFMMLIYTPMHRSVGQPYGDGTKFYRGNIKFALHGR